MMSVLSQTCLGARSLLHQSPSSADRSTAEESRNGPRKIGLQREKLHSRAKSGGSLANDQKKAELPFDKATRFFLMKTPHERTKGSPRENPATRSLRIRLLIIAALTLLAVVIIAFVGDQITLMLHRKHQLPVTDNLAVEINTFIARYYAHSVQGLATSGEIVEVCTGRNRVDNDSLLSVLNTARGALDVSFVFVMNTAGTVIGSSTSPEETSLTGHQYPFRPYFLQAVAGSSALYPAVGVTTKRKGFYFSAPVYAADNRTPVGVVVIKTKSESIDTLFTALRGKLEALLLSPDGVVFASTHEDWNFRTAWPLSPNRLAEVKASKQFGDYKLQPLHFSLQEATAHHNGIRHTVVSHPLEIDGWRIVTLKSVPFPWAEVLLLGCIVVSIGILSGVVVRHGYKEQQLTGQVLAGQEVSNQVKAAHRASVRELETIFSASLVGIILVRDGRVVNANRRMTEMFGYSRKEFLEGDIRQLFTGRRAFRRFVQRHLHQLIESDVEQVEYQLKRKNGTVLPCTLSGKAIDPKNLAKGTVWVVEDISRRKAAEKELELAREAAEAASIAKGEFLANMSHEIRTPMNGIIGLANIMLQEAMPDAQRERLELIRRSAIRLMTIINDILDFSKLEAGRYELHPQPFSLRGAMKEIIRPMEPTVQGKNLQFSLTVDAAVPDVMVADQTKLMQVLTNLIDNSLKFTRKGQITVRVSLEESTMAAEQSLLFEVADTGIGITQSYQAKVFESFTQADSSHARQFGGTGLGLSISKGLVELMGGRIWFDSELERGSCFFFTLPFVAPENGLAPTPDGWVPHLQENGPGPQGHGLRILVAEDEYINSILIRTLLQQAGYHVTMVKNGREALDAWRGGVFDCILLDIQMPEMDGYEVVARIREAEKKGEHILVIAMTAHAMNSDRRKCLAAGMDDYIAKPIDGATVLHLLQQHLSGRRAAVVVAEEMETS
jgi:PAS domain S-box-containing protein